MEKVLITGADGFIGSHLVKKMLDEGKTVIATVHPSRNIYQDSKNERLVVKCMDLSYISCRVGDFPDDIDVMYHFAWIGVNPELRNNLDIQIKNINVTVDCMRLAAAKGIKKVIFPGSTNEYLYYGKPIDKDAVPSPNDAYGATKVALRFLCSDFAKQNNIGFIYSIITGIYAADRRDNNVIFYTISKLLHGEKPSLTKLEQLWDYVYIDDVIDAFYLMGEKGKPGAIYAVGHGDNWPLYKYITTIHQLIDPSISLGIGEIPYSSNILPSSCINLTDIERDTGFKPKVDFETGIAKVIGRVKQDIKKGK